MLHLLPFDTEFGPTTYIYGVATAESHRHRGLASQLMRQAMALIEERGNAAAFLIQPPARSGSATSTQGSDLPKRRP